MKSSEQDAIDELIEAYRKTFGVEPDNVTGMVIRSSTKRVLAGESFCWVQNGNWRQIVWGDGNAHGWNVPIYVGAGLVNEDEILSDISCGTD